MFSHHHLPNLVAQKNFTRRLAGADEKECQVEDVSKTNCTTEAEKDVKGKGKARVEEQPSFGFNSKMRLESVRPSPKTPTWASGGAQERVGQGKAPAWGGGYQAPRAKNGGNGNQGGGWGNTNQSAPSGNVDSGNQASASTVGDKWIKQATAQGFQMQDGDRNKRWGTWSGGGNGSGWVNMGNSNDNTGANADYGKVFEANQAQPAENCNWNFSQNNNQQPPHYSYVRSQHPSLTQDPTKSQRQNETQPWNQTLGDTHTAKVQQQQDNQEYDPTDKETIMELTLQCSNHQIRAEYQNNTIIEYAKLIKELSEQNANQAEFATEQRVRIAVLENERMHVNKTKEDAVNASIIITQTLGSAFASVSGSHTRRALEDSGSLDRDGEIRKLKQEIEILEKENSLLESFLNDTVEHFEQGMSSDEEYKIPRTPLYQRISSRRRESARVNLDKGTPRLSANAKGKGKERMVEPSKSSISVELGVSTPDATNKKQVRGKGLRKAYEKDKAPAALKKDTAETATRPSRKIEKASQSEQETKGVTGWNESFTTDAPTVPNSPILNPANSQVVDRQFTDTFTSDVGLQSLEDLLAGDIDGHLSIPVIQNDKEENLQLPPELEAQIRTVQHLANLPTPTVLKAGFDMKNAKRGAEYHHLAPLPEPHRGRMSSYNRFGATSIANHYSNITVRELWASPEERERIVTDHQRQCGRDCIRYPDIFRYGIQYVPEEDDENYFRTVCISNLPKNVELRDVLARVRGGLVASAVLMDTRRLMGGKMSAMVVFVEDYDAQAFVDYVSAHPIIFDCDDKAQNTVVIPIPTPTYPMFQGLKKRMKHDRKGTRCIAIRNVPGQLSLSKLQYDISCGNRHRADNLVEIYLDHDNTLHLEFSNMVLASSAFGILTNWIAYRGLDVIYEPDPCAGPLADLVLPFPPRPPILPRNRLPSPPFDPNSSSDSLNKRTGRFVGVGGDIISQQCKRLAALSGQKVEIPSFSGSGITSSSWADEVIEESESSDLIAAPSNLTCPVTSLHAEYDAYDEAPYSHSEAPPNSPVDGILPMNVKPSMEVKEAVDAIMMNNVNVLMKENPSSFRKAPVGLIGSKYTSLLPKFEDGLQPLRSRNRRPNPAKSTGEIDGGVGNNGSQPDMWKAGATPSASEEGKGNAIEISPIPQSHPELKPPNLLAAALYSESESSSHSDHSSPKNRSPEDATSRAARNPFNTPYASPSSELTQKPCSSYVLKKPTYSPYCSPVQKSPTHKSRYPAQHSTPLEDFNRDFEAKEADPSTSRDSITSPNLTTPHQSPSTPPFNRQNAKVYNRQVVQECYPTSDSAPEGECTKEYIAALKNSTPKTKERYAKLIEIGRGVGEFGGRAGGSQEMIPELRMGSPESDSSTVLGDDSFMTRNGGKDRGVEAEGKRMDEGKEKINPDESGLDMEDAMEDASAEDGVKEEVCVYQVASCEGYMSIGG